MRICGASLKRSPFAAFFVVLADEAVPYLIDFAVELKWFRGNNGCLKTELSVKRKERNFIPDHCSVHPHLNEESPNGSSMHHHSK